MKYRGSPIRRVESQIQLSGSRFRYRRAWLPEEPRRVMVIVHGYADHCERYDEMALYFSERGFAVHAYDQSGHGRTRGPRGDVDQFDRMLDDLAEFVEFAGSDHPGLSVVLVGHNMGGLIATASHLFRSSTCDQLVLSGATLAPPVFGMGAWKRNVSRVLAPLGSRMGMTVGLDSRMLSRDPDVIRRFDEDRLVADRMSARFLSGMLNMVDRVSSSAGRVARPVLLLHGESDSICSVSGSAEFYANLAGPVAAVSRLHTYPDLRHEIFQEPERHQVWQDMLTWIEETSGVSTP